MTASAAAWPIAVRPGRPTPFSVCLRTSPPAKGSPAASRHPRGFGGVGELRAEQHLQHQRRQGGDHQGEQRQNREDRTQCPRRQPDLARGDACQQGRRDAAGDDPREAADVGGDHVEAQLPRRDERDHHELVEPRVGEVRDVPDPRLGAERHPLPDHLEVEPEIAMPQHGRDEQDRSEGDGDVDGRRRADGQQIGDEQRDQRHQDHQDGNELGRDHEAPALEPGADPDQQHAHEHDGKRGEADQEHRADGRAILREQARDRYPDQRHRDPDPNEQGPEGDNELPDGPAAGGLAGGEDVLAEDGDGCGRPEGHEDRGEVAPPRCPERPGEDGTRDQAEGTERRVGDGEVGGRLREPPATDALRGHPGIPVRGQGVGFRRQGLAWAAAGGSSASRGRVAQPSISHNSGVIT